MIRALSDIPARPVTTRMLVNVTGHDEIRIAIMDGPDLQQFMVERTSNQGILGNIYYGNVNNVEPGIQAGFVDIGREKNGFLHVSDIHLAPEEKKEFLARRERERESRGESPANRAAAKRGDWKSRDYLVQNLLRRNQHVITQVTKDGVNHKGPSLTTMISMPGKYLVLMPVEGKSGVSRKIEDDRERDRLKKIAAKMKCPDGMGFIIRTAGIGRSHDDLQADLDYLVRLWGTIAERARSARKPQLLYQESDLVIRTIRELFTPEIDEVVIDDAPAFDSARGFIQSVMPDDLHKLKPYRGHVPIFAFYGAEPEIDKVMAREVRLPSGGSIVIEQTEALVAIDINSGKFKAESDPETTAFRTNCEAAVEIARQLRIRDMGGLIMCDFIDMLSMSHRRDLENRFREALKDDRAKTKTTGVSIFGIIEMTRQRIRPAIHRFTHVNCPTCRGRGMVPTTESYSLTMLRRLREHMTNHDFVRFEVVTSPELALEVMNKKRRELVNLEELFQKPVELKTNSNYEEGTFEIVGITENEGRVVTQPA
jgi:ribonuclease E